jgi:hypothetical protein
LKARRIILPSTAGADIEKYGCQHLLYFAHRHPMFMRNGEEWLQKHTCPVCRGSAAWGRLSIRGLGSYSTYRNENFRILDNLVADRNRRFYDLSVRRHSVITA